MGYYFQKSSGLPLMQMYVNDATLKVGVSHPRVDLPHVIDLVASGRFESQKVTTLVADWNDAPDAYMTRTTKVVVHRPRLSAPRGQDPA